MGSLPQPYNIEDYRRIGNDVSFKCLTHIKDSQIEISDPSGDLVRVVINPGSRDRGAGGLIAYEGLVQNEDLSAFGGPYSKLR